ncbi:MAG: pyridoxamine 5'-phosphate oxidase [Flavobacteriaceae bacterium]
MTDSTPEGLTKGVLSPDADPMALFAAWLEEAGAGEPNDPNAMALATVDADGMPDVRMVLLKGFDARGFSFYTNLASAKGRELAANPKAALCFHWKSLRRQIRVRGEVEPVSDSEADEYFASRHRLSRLGAWASRQSAPLESRRALERAVARYTAEFAIGRVPRPVWWSGFRIVPREIEFWADRPFRLHERIRFTAGGDGGWHAQRLYP